MRCLRKCSEQEEELRSEALDALSDEEQQEILFSCEEDFTGMEE